MNTIFILRPQSYFQRVLSTLLFQEDHINGTVNYTFNHSSSNSSSSSPNSKNKSPLNVSHEQRIQTTKNKNSSLFLSLSLFYSLINLNRRKPGIYIYTYMKDQIFGIFLQHSLFFVLMIIIIKKTDKYITRPILSSFSEYDDLGVTLFILYIYQIDIFIFKYSWGQKKYSVV